MIALRDFAYAARDGQRVEVKQGQAVDPARLAEARCDVEKLARVKFVGQETVVVAPKRRGRPPKARKE
jgi:hypothetical protein